MRAAFFIFALVLLASCGSKKSCEQKIDYEGSLLNDTTSDHTLDFISENGYAFTLEVPAKAARYPKVDEGQYTREPYSWGKIGTKVDAHCEATPERRTNEVYLATDPAAAPVKICFNSVQTFLIEKTAACPRGTREQRTAGIQPKP